MIRVCVSTSNEVGVNSIEGVDGDVVEVAVAVGYVVSHVVWSSQVDCGAFVIDAVASVGQRHVAYFLFWCFPWVEEDVDHINHVCPCEVSDSVFMVGDPDVVVPIRVFGEGGAHCVVSVQVGIHVDVEVVDVPL